ncbi:MAG: M20 aminoacylase family protein [Janthinobacterium lividum]
MKIIPEILAVGAETRAIRHDIHAHPELGFEVHRTADLVASKLTSWGITVVRGIGRTGLVGTLKRGSSTRAIGLRADMDALPVNEANTFAHRSTTPGRMHACGHDGHTAMLLGAARYLAEHADFDGTVHFFFQPAEEAGGGAQAMIDDGLFERFPVDAVFGVHNWPGMPEGRFGVRVGPLMASTSDFRIDIKGVGAHGAMPHNGRDPLFVGTQIANALQGIITRNKKPVDTAVLSITQFHAGDANNVVPDQAWLGGTVRTFTEDTLNLIESRMHAIAAPIAAAFECEAVVDFVRNYPPTINEAGATAFAADVIADTFGEEHLDRDVEPTMGAEDFSYMLKARPGCYAFLGNGAGEHRGAEGGMGPCSLHNPSYDFNDALLPIGSTYFVKLVERFLAK